MVFQNVCKLVKGIHEETLVMAGIREDET